MSLRENPALYSPLWMEYPVGSGNYIHKRGKIWKLVHQQECWPCRYNFIKNLDPLPNPVRNSLPLKVNLFGSQEQPLNIGKMA